MMTTSSVDLMVELKHILNVVLDLPPNSALEMAIMQNGLSSIMDVINYSDEDLAALTFHDGFTTVVAPVKKKGTTMVEQNHLIPGMIAHIRNLCQLMTYCHEQSDSISDWTTVTRDEYLHFLRHVNHFYVPSTPAPASSPAPSVVKSLTSVIPSYQKDPLA